MAKTMVDVMDVADAYKKDGHKVGPVKREKEGHYSFKRTSPDGRTFEHKFTPTGTKLVTGPKEAPHGVDADDGERSDAAPVKRGRGRPKGTTSGAARMGQ